MPSQRVLKRKPEEDDVRQYDSDGSFSTRDRASRPAKRARGKSLSRLSRRSRDGDEDKGREGSRKFQDWAKWLKETSAKESSQSKNFFNEFRKKVDKQREQMIIFLKQRQGEVGEKTKTSVQAFDKIYVHATQMDLPNELPSPKSQGASKESLSLFQNTQAIISRSRALVKLYKDTDSNLKSQTFDVPDEMWKKDKQNIKEILARGREHGEKIVEGNLAPEIHASLDDDTTKTSEHEQMASGIFKDSRKTLEGDNWGTIAAEQVNTIKALAKTVSVEDTS